MKKAYNFIVPLVLFPFDIMFSIGESNELFDRSLFDRLQKCDYDSLKASERIIWDMGDTCRGRCVHNYEGGQTIIRVKGINTPEHHGVLAHEIKHAIDFILWHKLGIVPTKNNDELFAYAIGYVTEQVYKTLKGKP